MKKIIHYDKKILTPSDKLLVGTGNEKPVRGFVIVENDKGERRGENLVVLGGREFLLSKMVDLPSPSFSNSHKYKLRYFGIGSGGSTLSEPSGLVVKKGPYSDDSDLYEPLKFNEGNSPDEVTYIDKGYLKSITADASKGSGFTFVNEKHTIESSTGMKDVHAYTIIKITIFVNEDEFEAIRPFQFSEAGLWAVEYGDDGKPVINADGTARKKLFAHFTTSPKILEATDTLKIEWYILL